MAAYPKKVDFAQGFLETTPRRDRQSVGVPEAAANTPALWRVVSRDDLICEAELDQRTSSFGLASADAGANSPQRRAGTSPTCAKPNVGMPRAEAAPRLSGNLESHGEAGRASPPEHIVEPSRISAPVALRPGALDTDLCRLIHLWLILPQRQREAVLALIDAIAPS